MLRQQCGIGFLTVAGCQQKRRQDSEQNPGNSRIMNVRDEMSPNSNGQYVHLLLLLQKSHYRQINVRIFFSGLCVHFLNKSSRAAKIVHTKKKQYFF